MRGADPHLGGLLALVGLSAWLLAVVTAEHVPEPETVAGATEWAPRPSGGEPHAPKPIGAYAETLARPVFFKTRQPYVPPPPASRPAPKPVAAPPPAPVDPGLALGGVMITEGARKAYVFSKVNSQGSWLREGDTIGGWKVEAVEAMSARLQQAGRTIELQLYPKR